jgi:hypothetical protein
MKYVGAPKELQSADVRASEACFSPGRYVRFIPPAEKGGSHYETLDKIVIVRDETLKARKDGRYRYAEIGDINTSTGGVTFRPLRGFELPTPRPAVAKQGDILISTVRTYRKGIGRVAEQQNNLVTTNAFLNICGTKTGLPLSYVYAFLRSDFFVEQVWSLLHRGVYPRMDTGALNKIIVPIPDDPQVSTYVAALADAIDDKEAQIRERNQRILSAIEAELSANQGGKPFSYEYPSSAEVRLATRLDTGLYCKGFRAFKHTIEHYKHGATTLSEMGVRSRRGPNLAVSIIGHSLYSTSEKAEWYELIRPVNISEHGTLDTREWLGTPKALATVKQGELILGCEGFEKGRSLVLIDAPNRCTTNFHGTVLYWPGAETWEIVFVRCFLAYLRAQGVIDWVGVGGSGGHMSPEYFDYLPFPKFPKEVRKTIAALYHSPATPPKGKLTLQNFVQWHRAWNANAGIWELDKEMRQLQRTLENLKRAIIEGQGLKLSF